MRSEQRLDTFYEEFKNIHKRYFCDWRFGQLCSNFFGWLMQSKHIDLFFPEEEDMLKYLNEFVSETVNP